MYRWFNPSQPQTLMAAVFLGYLSAVFLLLSPTLPFLGPGLSLLVAIGLGVGAFGTANSKKWGYFVLLASAGIRALVAVLVIAIVAPSVIETLFFLNRAVFPVALAAAVIHPHSREYIKVWFE